MAKNPVLKIGLIGVDNVTSQHLEVLKRLKRFNLVGVYDQNIEFGNKFSENNKIQYYSSWKKLIEDVDVIDLNMSTEYQYEICQYAIKRAKHLFVVNRLQYDVEKVSKLVEYVEEAGVVVQFHSKYRFRKLYLQILPYIYFPLFIESFQNLKRRKVENDDSWFEEMNSRMQWILSIVNSLPKKVQGDGVSVSTKDLKVINTRVEFDNACVANLNLNGVVQLTKDELNLFHPKLYIQINLADNTVNVESFVNPQDLKVTEQEKLDFVKSSENTWKVSLMDKTEKVESVLELELKAFYDSIVFGKKVSLDLSNALQSLEIMDSISIV